MFGRKRIQNHRDNIVFEFFEVLITLQNYNRVRRPSGKTVQLGDWRFQNRFCGD